MNTDRGPIFTRGRSFRARAEARQREYRADVLEAGWKRYGHRLDDAASSSGANFVYAEIFEAALERQRRGKGVAARIFENMLSSQAMCFNLFVPLSRDLELATAVFAPFIPEMVKVLSVEIEYTPPNNRLGDQSGQSGVDCDVLIVGERADGTTLVIALETKFVETGFSVCGFRKSGRAAKGFDVCADSVSLRDGTSTCLYELKKSYRYWERTKQYGFLLEEALPERGCPFAGQLWQPWVNLALAHTEAERRGAGSAVFVVCAPAPNERLLRGGRRLDEFRRVLADPSTVLFLDLDKLLRTIESLVEAIAEPARVQWAKRLMARYGGI